MRQGEKLKPRWQVVGKQQRLHASALKRSVLNFRTQFRQARVRLGL
jgi:hypothetical protein